MSTYSHAILYLRQHGAINFPLGPSDWTNLDLDMIDYLP